MAKSSKSEKADEFVPTVNPYLAAGLAWFVPFLSRPSRTWRDFLRHHLALLGSRCIA